MIEQIIISSAMFALGVLLGSVLKNSEYEKEVDKLHGLIDDMQKEIDVAESDYSNLFHVAKRFVP